MADGGGVFDAASEATRAELGQRQQLRAFRPGEALFHAGDPPRTLFLTQCGRVKAWRVTEAGTLLTLAYVHAGDLLGMIAIAQRKPHGATATALTEVAALTWPAELILELSARDAGFAGGTAAFLARRAELMIGRMEELSFASVDQRVARTLLRLGAEMGEDGDGGPLHIAVGQREIADLAQTTVPTVSRLLGRWRTRRLIGATRGAVTILDRAALLALSGMDR